MPAYNAQDYIAEAFESVLTQTFTNYELIVVNDGSTDRTAEVVQSFKDPRIRLVNQVNGGVSAALNTGLDVARGRYIIRFDADDVCYKNRFEVQYNFITRHPEYILVGSDADYMTENGEMIHHYVNIGHSHEEILKTIEKHCSFIHSSVIYLREAVLKLGGYEVRAHTFEDYFLWKKLIKTGKVCNLKMSLMKVRFNPASVTIDEKDQDPEFRALKRKALQTGEISETEATRLLSCIKKLEPQKKLASYNRLLAKKFLWDNYQPSKSRKHSWAAAKAEPLKGSAWVLLAMSFLPEAFIKWLYLKMKGK